MNTDSFPPQWKESAIEYRKVGRTHYRDTDSSLLTHMSAHLLDIAEKAHQERR